jgi:hypothetical protein
MKEIVKGIKRHHLDGETKESIRRMSICNSCDSKMEDPLFGARCKECGCILKYKVKSNSTCPLKKW